MRSRNHEEQTNAGQSPTSLPESRSCLPALLVSRLPNPLHLNYTDHTVDGFAYHSAYLN